MPVVAAASAPVPASSSSSSSTLGTVLLVTAGLLGAATLAYAWYFDRRRRTDPAFRRHLRTARGRPCAGVVRLVADACTPSLSHTHTGDLDREDRRLAREAEKSKVRRDPLTVPASGKPDCPAGSVGQPVVLTQAVLRRELEKAESLARAGAHDAAAEVLFRLLHVYPNPEELLMLIQQSLPEPVYAGIIRRLQREVRRAAVSTPGGRRPADRPPPTHTHTSPPFPRQAMAEAASAGAGAGAGARDDVD
jgi:mitochondrial import receptor subunit TOM20